MAAAPAVPPAARRALNANLGTITNLPSTVSLACLTYNVLAGVRVHDDGGHWLWPAVQRRHDTAAPTLPARRRTSAPSQANSCWSSSALRRLGRRHTTKPSRTGHAEYASRRSLRSVGMVIVGAKACDAKRRETMSPVARGRVLSRIMIWRLLGMIAYYF